MDGFYRLDATSGSMQVFDGVLAKNLSPMILRNEEGCVVENVWQYSKVYPQLDHIKGKKLTTAWKQWHTKGIFQEKGTRRPIEVLKLKRQKQQWTPSCAYYDGVFHDYISSRKHIYVPQYYNALIRSKIFPKLPRCNLLILDYDGPKEPLEITPTSLRTSINNPDEIFCHGYVLAATLLNIHPEEYII